MIIRLLKSTAILGVAAFVMLFNTVQTDYKYAITPKGEDDIIKLTVCSDDCTEECKNGLHSFGHSFLTAENLTDSSVMLYDYKMKPHETVTFSWWAVDKHMGVWFNIESCYINLTTRYNNLRTVSMYIDANEVETLSHFLENNDYYTPLSNCSKQVIRCWNTIADSDEMLCESKIMTPAKLISEITRFSSWTSLDIGLNTNICYFDNGKAISFTMEV